MKHIYLLIMLGFFSCKKKADLPPFDITNLNGGSSKTWILNDITTNGKSIIDNCAKDDEYTFRQKDTVVDYTPNVKCFLNDDPNSLNYRVEQNGKIIIINDTQYTIDFLDNKKLIISHDGMDNARIAKNNKTLHQQQTLKFLAK